MGVVNFPVNLDPHLSNDARDTELEGDSLISCHESVCSVCGGELLVTEHEEGVALTQRFTPIPVRIERKKCAACGVAAVAGDDWREHGYFVFGAYAAHLTALVEVRTFVSGGMSITTMWRAQLARCWRDMQWLEEYPLLANRLPGSDDFLHTLMQLYLAFEALTDRPYEFSSIVHGFFPEPTSRGGGGNTSTKNNATLEKFLAEGEEMVVDVDLSACWLVLSMLSPMVFSKRLRFVYTPPMAFSPRSRKSNLFVLKAKGRSKRQIETPPARPKAKRGPEGAVETLPARLKAKGGVEGVLSANGTGEGNSNERGGEKPPPETDTCTQQDNVYDVWRLAAVNPPVQRGTNFFSLLDTAATEAGEAGDTHAADFLGIALDHTRELRRLGRYSVDLFEVVAVLNARLATVLAEAELQGGGGTDAEELSVLVAFRAFSSGVLAVAVGSATGEVPALPAFFRDLPKAEVGVIGDVTSVAAMVLYAEAKEEFIASKLRPADARRKTIAVQALRSGAPFGAAVCRPKAIQIWASHGNPEFLATRENKQVDGFDISFNVGPPEDRPQAKKSVLPRALDGAHNSGPVRGACCCANIVECCPGRIFDASICRSDHGGDVERRRKTRELDARAEQEQLLQAVRHPYTRRQRQQQQQQQESCAKNKSEKHSDVLSELDFDRLAFMGALVNEVEMEESNRDSSNAMVKAFDDHPHEKLFLCELFIYNLGRCFCDKPLVRSYDEFGRAYLSSLLK